MLNGWVLPTRVFTPGRGILSVGLRPYDFLRSLAKLGQRLAVLNIARKTFSPRYWALVWNVRQLVDGRFQSVGKVTGIVYDVPLVKGSTCTQKPEEQESRFCHECHAEER